MSIALLRGSNVRGFTKMRREWGLRIETREDCVSLHTRAFPTMVTRQEMVAVQATGLFSVASPLRRAIAARKLRLAPGTTLRARPFDTPSGMNIEPHRCEYIIAYRGVDIIKYSSGSVLLTCLERVSTISEVVLDRLNRFTPFHFEPESWAVGAPILVSLANQLQWDRESGQAAVSREPLRRVVRLSSRLGDPSGRSHTRPVLCHIMPQRARAGRPITLAGYEETEVVGDLPGERRLPIPTSVPHEPVVENTSWPSYGIDWLSAGITSNAPGACVDLNAGLPEPEVAPLLAPQMAPYVQQWAEVTNATIRRYMDERAYASVSRVTNTNNRTNT